MGCTYLQLDDTSLAYLNDPRQREMVVAQGGDGEHEHERYVRQINDALSGRPEGLRVTTHMCRGNLRSSWAAEGGYDFVAEAVFSGRIDAATKFVSLEQLCLSPQCGFSSTVAGNSLTYDEQVSKLRLVVETAAEVWG